MTHKEFVPYAEALALKELHFDEPCLGIHYNEGLNPSFIVASQYGEHGAAENGGILAPLYQQAFRFFREKYELYSWVKVEYEYGGITPTYYITGKRQDDIAGGSFNTYEEAELECLKKLIEITKQK
jgi:hypothetical protein